MDCFSTDKDVMVIILCNMVFSKIIKVIDLIHNIKHD